ncbi:S1C family serine protease [Nocardioides aequoreus]|uniref:S1C family serine protease n=1 Tax=Nocardioides aequoreus TaxID=397278 RepID=UPI0014706E9A|nr:trypsin-like peptidase domain-containing protein [Nocardioides aequoreus]
MSSEEPEHPQQASEPDAGPGSGPDPASDPAPDRAPDPAPGPAPAPPAGMGQQRPGHPGFSAPPPADDPWTPRPVPPWVPPAQPHVAVTSPDPRAQPGSGRVPRWVWPGVAALALVVGVTGGLLGGVLVAGDGSGVGSVISVERRTAPPLPADNGSIAAVAEELLPSTVQIIAESGQGATGSGFVYDDEGHVVTNNHVIADAAQAGGRIQVVDQDGNRSVAEVVGRSTVYDLAVLRAEGAEGMPPAAIGSSQQMRVGETVVAIGSPLGLSSTVTSGIVSALERPVTTGSSEEDSSYINAVQTDAAINPGNSGGPLVDLQGRVVGVNSAIASLGGAMSPDQGGNIGVGFAIPVEQVEVTTTQILRTGRSQYPVIGANVQGLATRDGARVDGITRGSAAAESDLEVGDIIRRVDDKPVTSSIDVVVAVRSRVAGEEVTLEVERDGEQQEITVGLKAETE